MRTTSATIGIAAAVLAVSFLMPENRPGVPAPAYSLASGSDQPAVEGGGSAPSGALPARPVGTSLDGYRSGDDVGMGFAAQGDGTGRPVARGETEADRAARARLEQVLPSVEFPEGTSLSDVVEYLRDAGGLDIGVSWAALEQAGVERATDSAGLRLHNVKVKTVLALLLNNISAVAEERIGYQLFQGVVLISTVSELDRHVTLRVYDCRDLLGMPLTDRQREALKDLLSMVAEHDGNARAASQGESEASIPAGAPPLQADPNHPTPLRRALSALSGSRDADLAAITAALLKQDEQELVDLITRVIEPMSWSDQGGTGSIDVWSGRLIVRHTTRTHEQILELLTLLRETRTEVGTATLRTR